MAINKPVKYPPLLHIPRDVHIVCTKLLNLVRQPPNDRRTLGSWHQSPWDWCTEMKRSQRGSTQYDTLPHLIAINSQAFGSIHLSPLGATIRNRFTIGTRIIAQLQSTRCRTPLTSSDLVRNSPIRPQLHQEHLIQL